MKRFTTEVFNEVPANHRCALCYNPLKHKARYICLNWEINLWQCNVCADITMSLTYNHNPQNQRSYRGLQELVHEIDEQEGRYVKPSELVQELSECPFCHQRESLRVERTGMAYRVICDANANGCGGATGWADSVVEAIHWWNNRSALNDKEAPTCTE